MMAVLPASRGPIRCTWKTERVVVLQSVFNFGGNLKREPGLPVEALVARDGERRQLTAVGHVEAEVGQQLHRGRLPSINQSINATHRVEQRRLHPERHEAVVRDVAVLVDGDHVERIGRWNRTTGLWETSARRKQLG